MNKELHICQEAYIKMNESKKQPGNYASINVKSIDLPKDSLPKSGKIVSRKNRHATLIYSENSNMPMGDVSKLLEEFPKQFAAKGTEFAVFDNPDKGDTVALVLKVKATTLQDMSDKLIEAGLKHSYDTIDHHMTVAYDVDKVEAESIKNKMNGFLKEFGPIDVVLSGLNVNPIIDDWSDKMK